MAVCTLPSGATTTCSTIYPYASSSANLTSAFSDTGVLVTLVVGAIVAGVIALYGLGYGIRHVKKWITGRKF